MLQLLLMSMLLQLMASWCIVEKKGWRVDGNMKQYLKFSMLGKNKLLSFASLDT